MGRPAVVLLIVLVAQWYVRLGVLLVLAMISPLALACYVLPGLDQAAGLWWRTLAGTLGTQTLQALMIVGGWRGLLDPDSQLVIVLPTGVGNQLVAAGSPVNLLIRHQTSLRRRHTHPATLTDRALARTLARRREADQRHHARSRSGSGTVRQATPEEGDQDEAHTAAKAPRTPTAPLPLIVLSRGTPRSPGLL